MISEPQPLHQDNESVAPSRDFIQAISEFLDTDPADLLMELGYYSRENTDVFAEQELATSASV